MFDQIQHVIGDLQNIQPHLQLQRPNVLLRDSATKEVVEVVKSDVPDLIIFNGNLAASQKAVEGANVLFRFRRGQAFPGEPGLTWAINGEKGEIRLQAFSGATLHANSYDAPVTLEVHDFASDKVEKVDWSWQDWQEALPVVGRSIAVLYDKFADGPFEGQPTFETALVRHEQLETILADWDPK